MFALQVIFHFSQCEKTSCVCVSALFFFFCLDGIIGFDLEVSNYILLFHFLQKALCLYAFFFSCFFFNSPAIIPRSASILVILIWWKYEYININMQISVIPIIPNSPRRCIFVFNYSIHFIFLFMSLTGAFSLFLFWYIPKPGLCNSNINKVHYSQFTLRCRNIHTPNSFFSIFGMTSPLSTYPSLWILLKSCCFCEKNI